MPEEDQARYRQQIALNKDKERSLADGHGALPGHAGTGSSIGGAGSLLGLHGQLPASTLLPASLNLSPRGNSYASPHSGTVAGSHSHP